MQTHPELLGLLDDVLDNPGDDGPRLVTADWLEDHGDEARAEFIRAQCALARLDLELCSGEDCDDPRCAGCAERRSLRRRERELWGWWREEWFPPYRSIGGLFGPLAYALEPDGNLGVPNLIVRRGFVAEVRLTLDAFRAHAAELFSWHPVEEVVLTDRKPHQTVYGCGWFARQSGNIHDAEDLPRRLWTLLPAESRPDDWWHWKCFDSPGQAHAALSAACALYGKQAAAPIRLERMVAAGTMCEPSGR